MTTHVRSAMLAATAIIWSIAPSHAIAADVNHPMVIALDETLKVPGATLEPDTYTFQLADDRNTRESVRIIRESDHKLMTTATVVPVKHSEDDHELAIEVVPTGDDVFPTLKGWLEPGGGGYEFVFPKAQTRRIEQSGPAEIIQIAPRGLPRPPTS